MSAATRETTQSVISKTHISLHVADMERSVKFYESFFGVPAHKRRPGYANFDLQNPPLKLALEEDPARAVVAGRLSHLGIQVATTEEVDATRARLGISGVVMFDEGDTVCCYARQDKVWATDPDGNGWEVYVLLDDMNDEDHDHDHEHWQAHGHNGKGTLLGQSECSVPNAATGGACCAPGGNCC